MRRADRLFQIIQILRRSTRPITASQIAEELETSRRSVYRDIADLIGQRVPIRGEAGLGYVLDRDYDMPPLMLTPDELEAAVLGAQWVADKGDAVLAAAARDLIAKIATMVPERLRPFVSEPSVGAPLARTATAADGLDIARARAAIRKGRKIRIRYRDEQDKESERVVWPTMIGYAETVRLIAAWCELRQDFRHFRTDRITMADFLDERFGCRPAELRSRWKRHMQAQGLRLPGD
ncbi:YafY family protein [Mesorhizobium sp.]|uniref:helix-turn-helix transcriptional regulator n=1 Tax=Mesorhizobium sp. TaxID=1871066 RepID=UPI000FE2E9D7|nr:YafY family protein [Mesorhizobium sp.]RWG83475.1 MAG: YafY family transcriptional regulator [Mesorhizobium sp.]RWG87477.1 MAG: YafY family transcriptional regulator [Mesorhizobium sp.]RWK01231.1 MAG: YafY family transcriptional regulator [Mesorhizobium sp.]RWK11642.1 MAG: YafY family transcriptional regulator [Mesorhizobium sp.]RWK13659.1 MAG: YafY family transcriptional regulator [Mesorhizobium sp.]